MKSIVSVEVLVGLYDEQRVIVEARGSLGFERSIIFYLASNSSWSDTLSRSKLDAANISFTVDLYFEDWRLSKRVDITVSILNSCLQLSNFIDTIAKPCSGYHSITLPLNAY